MHISHKHIHKCSSLDHARTLISDKDVVGSHFHCLVYRQGDRVMLSAAIAVKHLPHFLDRKKGFNRKHDSKHVSTIRKYIVENPNDFILPPLSAAFDEAVDIFVWSASEDPTPALVFVPAGVKAHVTDGQHRYMALVGDPEDNIKGAFSEVSALAAQGILVQMVIETDVDRIHRDFAEMAQTKALPQSLLKSWVGDPTSKFAKKLRNASFLKEVDYVENQSTRLGKSSMSLILFNYLTNLIVGAATKSFTNAKTAVAQANRIVEGPESQGLFADLQYLLKKAESIPEIAQYMQTPHNSTAAVDIPDLRHKCLFVQPWGMNLVGVILYHIRCNAKGNSTFVHRKIDELVTQIDWTRPRNGSHAIWGNGGVIGNNGATDSHTAHMQISLQRILKQLNL